MVRLTLKFNRAWLSETHPAQPDIAEAMSEYLSLAEDSLDWATFAPAYFRPAQYVHVRVSVDVGCCSEFLLKILDYQRVIL